MTPDSSCDFVLELFSEEIPARLQESACTQLHTLLTQRLNTLGLNFSGLETHVTPRRLTALVSGLPQQQPDRSTEKKGPRVGAPEKALEGFLQANGAHRDDLTEQDTGKGTFYFLVQQEKGLPTARLLAQEIADMLLAFQWPKSMRWGNHRFRWVRPLRRITAVFNGAPLAGGLHLGNETRAPGYSDSGDHGFLAYSDIVTGHRLQPTSTTVSDIISYRAALADGGVVLDRMERAQRIRTRGDALAQPKGLRIDYPDALLNEVAGLSEWPVPLLGNIPEAFMQLPAEVLTTSMRVHQKYFPCYRADGTLAPCFLAVAGQEAPDGGAAILAGNEKVLAARLYDALFFWKTDQQQSLQRYGDKLASVIFHAKAGSIADKVARTAALAQQLAQLTGHDAAQAHRAAMLCKNDLTTGMVGEFPELQGIMGSYYAAASGEDKTIAQAIRQQYLPLPEHPLARVVAAADRLDSLQTLFAAGEAPTGSKDPYAMRRLAYGVLTITLESDWNIDLRTLTQHPQTTEFLRERTQQYFRDNHGIRAEVLRAVFSADLSLHLTDLRRKCLAVEAFVQSPQAPQLLQHYSRAANIVAQASDDENLVPSADNDNALCEPADQALRQAVITYEQVVEKALSSGNYADALTALGTLGQPLATFFDSVMVNTDNVQQRCARLSLLARIPRPLQPVAILKEIAV